MTLMLLRKMASISKIDFTFQIGIIIFKKYLFRAHLETAFHKKIAKRLREIRNDTIWVNGEDVSMAFKPMKMGLRVANLVEPWLLFE